MVGSKDIVAYAMTQYYIDYVEKYHKGDKVMMFGVMNELSEFLKRDGFEGLAERIDDAIDMLLEGEEERYWEILREVYDRLESVLAEREEVKIEIER